MGSQVTAKRFQRGTQARATGHCPPTVTTFRREVKPNHHHRSAEEYVRFFALNMTPTSLTTREIEEASVVAGSHSVVRSNPPEPIRSTALPDDPGKDLAVDLMGQLSSGHSFMVIIYYYSRFYALHYY